MKSFSRKFAEIALVVAIVLILISQMVSGFEIGEVEICNDVQGWRDYTIQPGSEFKTGDTYYIYVEALNIRHNGKKDVGFFWNVYDSNGKFVYNWTWHDECSNYEGVCEGDHHEAHHAEKIPPTWQGNYSVKIEIRDNIDGSKKSTETYFYVSSKSTDADIGYRTAGVIVVTLVLFIVMIFKIRKGKDERETPTTIKPIEKWKVTALIIGHAIALLWSFICILLGLYCLSPPNPSSYSPYEGYMLLLISIPFFLITAMILYNLIFHKKLHGRYLYFNISLCMLCIVFCAFFGELFSAFSRVEAVIVYALIYAIPLSILNFISLLITRNHGRELTIKGDIAHKKELIVPEIEGETTGLEEKIDLHPPARDVFISHVEEDYDVASQIANGLEAAGYTTWYYERDSFGGPSYLLQTKKAIESSQAFLVVISPHALSSTQMTKEVIRAHESGKHPIPILYGVTDVEYKNRQPEWQEAMGAATSLYIPKEGVSAIIHRIVGGLKELGIQPGGKVR